MNTRQIIPRDAIPSIDDPTFAAEYGGREDDEVIVVDADPPRAYPFRILNYHEIVNGTVDGRPIAVTWCSLCGSAIVYDRTVDGRTLTFCVSGKLADDDLVMYDRETDSEWKQSLGECIAGSLEGTTLTVLPASVVTWRQFRAEHPDGVVLQPTGAKSEAGSETDESAAIDYSMEPYEEYARSDGFGLAAHRGTGSERTWSREDIDPKTVVLGIESDGTAVGFPLPRVIDAGGVVTTTVGTVNVVVFATDEGIHAFENPGYSFHRNDDDRFAADGTVWNGATGESTDGRHLERIPARRLFAFAWQDDHGPEAFWNVEK